MCCWEKPIEAPRASDDLALLLSRIYEEAYCLSATTRNSDAVQMKIVLPHIAKWHETQESIELSNEMREKCVTEIMRGWFLFRRKLQSKKHTLLRVSFQRRRCITDLCWQVNVSVCNGKAERCNRHLDCLSWSREAYLTSNSRTRVTKLTTTSWTPNFSFENIQRVIKPQTFESNVWWVPMLHTNVETS